MQYYCAVHHRHVTVESKQALLPLKTSQALLERPEAQQARMIHLCLCLTTQQATSHDLIAGVLQSLATGRVSMSREVHQQLPPWGEPK